MRHDHPGGRVVEQNEGEEQQEGREVMELAKVYCSCGRYCLEVARVVVAMEGDKCRTMLPESCLDPIPADELATASIGGQPCSEMPIENVRFFRPEPWTERMLRHVAKEINDKATARS